MPKRPNPRKPPKPVEPPSRYHQFDLIEYGQRLDEVLAEPIPDQLFADLALVVEEELRQAEQPAKLEPTPGKLYTGRAVTGNHFAGYYSHQTHGGMAVLVDVDQKPVALVIPESLKEISE